MGKMGQCTGEAFAKWWPSHLMQWVFMTDGFMASKELVKSFIVFFSGSSILRVVYSFPLLKVQRGILKMHCLNSF